MVATQELYGSQINVPSTCEQLPHVSVLKHVIPIQDSNMIHVWNVWDSRVDSQMIHMCNVWYLACGGLACSGEIHMHLPYTVINVWRGIHVQLPYTVINMWRGIPVQLPYTVINVQGSIHVWTSHLSETVTPWYFAIYHCCCSAV